MSDLPIVGRGISKLSGTVVLRFPLSDLILFAYVLRCSAFRDIVIKTVIFPSTLLLFV